MASEPAAPVHSFARVEAGAEHDGKITFQEAVVLTEPLKLQHLRQPTIVNRPPGDLNVGDLPLESLTAASATKITHFVDVLTDCEAPFDPTAVEEMFASARYKDLAWPICIATQCLAPYTMQLIVLPQADGKKTFLKHIFMQANAKISVSTAKEMCQGLPFKIVFGNNFWNGTKAFQLMLEKLGGFQV